MQRRPELRNKPVAVCGDPEARHGIVLTASYPAKHLGIKTGMAIWQAREKCPELVILPPDMKEYIRISKYAREIYEYYTDQVESFGLDECFLDVTGRVYLIISFSAILSPCLSAYILTTLSFSSFSRYAISSLSILAPFIYPMFKIPTPKYTLGVGMIPAFYFNVKD